MDGASVTGDETGIHVFVMLPLDILNEQHKIQYGENPTDEVSSESELTNHLKTLQINGVKGVMVDCWWGRVEAAGPGRYKWDGYEKLFSIVRAAQLKLHVVMSFHACLEDGVETIPLPDWVKRIGNQKGLFYNDARDDPCTEYLSWAVDDKDVLEDDSSNQFSPLQVYENFMSKFKENMVKYLPGTITMIEVGLGPSGELRYPAYRSAWNIGPPAGIGAFQCYDKYMVESWKNEAEGQGFTIPCCVGPQTAGDYTSTPAQTQFFKPGAGLTNGISYTETYGKTFLTWYSKNLVVHGQKVLEIADKIFKPVAVKIAAKVPGVYWYCNDLSRAAEATAGLFTSVPNNPSVYESIAGILNNLDATFIFTCVEKADAADNVIDRPQMLVQEVLGQARRKGASIACENGSPTDDKITYNRIIHVAIIYDISYFTYMRLSRELMTDAARFGRFQKFVQGMNARTPIP